MYKIEDQIKRFLLTVLLVTSPSLFSGEKHFKDLNLSKEQKQKIEAIRNESKKEIQAQRVKVKELSEELKEKMNPQTSSSELAKLHASLLDEKQKSRTMAFEKMLKIRDVLTPEQREKAKLKWKMKFKDRHREVTDSES